MSREIADDISFDFEDICGDVLNLNSRAKFERFPDGAGQSERQPVLPTLRNPSQANAAGIQSVKVTRERLDFVNKDQALVDAQTAPTRSENPLKTVLNETNLSKKPRSRYKIPGPAGLLPPLAPGQSIESVEFQSWKAIRANAELQKLERKELECSQSQDTSSPFDTPSWRSMLRDLPAEARVLDRFNVAWILDKANRKELPACRAPFLCALLRKVTFHGAVAVATFADPTGEIQGTIQRKTLEDRGDKLHEGATVVLRKATVLSLTRGRHHLNVVAQNVVRVYSDIGEPNANRASLKEVLMDLEEGEGHFADGKGTSPEGETLQERDYFDEDEDDEWMASLDVDQCGTQNMK